MRYHDVGTIRIKDNQYYKDERCICNKCNHDSNFVDFESNSWHPDICNDRECECCTQDIPTEAEEE